MQAAPAQIGAEARARGALATLALASLIAACGGDAERVYDVQGIVRDVQPAYGQVVVEHEAIPGVMPGMTMNFDVADPRWLDELEPGQRIAFRLAVSPGSFRIESLETLGEAEADPGALGLDALATPDAPAPAFALVDQAGERLRSDDLRGHAVLLDFVFTHCPGPCPVLTARHVNVQRRLPDDVRARTRFVSITLDPARDTPEALRAYALARGADLAGWSFLTGPPDEVDAVVSAFGIGATRKPDGDIDHLVAAFLIDPQGRIAQRYLGLEVSADIIARDLARVARAVDAGGAG